MGQEVKVVYTDDLEKSRDKRVEVEPDAVRMEPLTWGGRSVKLVLSETTWKEIDAFLAPLLAVGDPPKGSERPAGHMNRDRVAAYRKLREWADKHNRSYRTPGGGYYYSAELVKDFTRDTGIEIP